MTWYLNGFPDGSNLGSTVYCRGEAHRYVCVFSFHLFWASSSLDEPAGVTQEEGHTGFLIHLPYAVSALTFLERRIQPFLSLVDREVEFCGAFNMPTSYQQWVWEIEAHNQLVHGDLPRQHSFGTTLRVTGPVPADSR